MTSTGENGRVLCNKTFCKKIPDFSPDSGFFRIFFKSRCSLDHFLQLLFNKLWHILISLGGDRARMRYVGTHTTSAIYILIASMVVTKQHYLELQYLISVFHLLQLVEVKHNLYFSQTLP